MTIKRLSLPLVAAFILTACGQDPAPASSEIHAIDPAPTLAEMLDSDLRSDADRARDAGRKPAEVLTVLGIEPGMRVLDVMAGGGWYTEVLATALGPAGHVTAHNTPGSLAARDGAREQEISARLADNRLPNVSRLNKDLMELSSEDGPFDAAITALNLHDVYNGSGEDAAVAVLGAIRSTLKPGGIFGVIDHQGKEGNDNPALHRMLKTDAIRVARAAGFIVEADSGVLHHHDDDMSTHIRDESIRGFTHRFVLKLRNPE